MKCYVCDTSAATRKVTVIKTDNTTWGYHCCKSCEPRHVPHGDVRIIHTEPIENGGP